MGTKKLQYKWYKCEPGNMPEDFATLMFTEYQTVNVLVKTTYGFIGVTFRLIDTTGFVWNTIWSGSEIQYWAPMPEDI